MIRDDRSVQYLKKSSSGRHGSGKDTNEELRTLAAISLGKIDSPEAKTRSMKFAGFFGQALQRMQEYTKGPKNRLFILGESPVCKIAGF